MVRSFCNRKKYNERSIAKPKKGARNYQFSGSNSLSPPSRLRRGKDHPKLRRVPSLFLLSLSLFMLLKECTITTEGMTPHRPSRQSRQQGSRGHVKIDLFLSRNYRELQRSTTQQRASRSVARLDAPAQKDNESLSRQESPRRLSAEKQINLSSALSFTSPYDRERKRDISGGRGDFLTITSCCRRRITPSDSYKGRRRKLLFPDCSLVAGGNVFEEKMDLYCIRRAMRDDAM